MTTWNCFISHRVVDRAIALTLKEKIESLTKNKVKAFVCEQIQGGKDWRKDIVDKIIDSDFLIFIYTIEDYDWRWCLFEIGMFNYKKEIAKRDQDQEPEKFQKNALLYFKNPQIKKIISPLSDIEHYEPNSAGIAEFYKTLLNGKFTDGTLLREDLVEDKTKEELTRAVDETEEKFDQSRLIVDYYDRRITINLKPSEDKMPVQEIEESRIEVNESTRHILKLPPNTETVPWRNLYNNFSRDHQTQWLDELKEALKSVRKREKPNKVMTPFKCDNTSYIPIISRVEKLLPKEKDGEDLPTKLNVIFIPRSFSKKGFLSTLHFFLPICTVRMNWKKMSGKLTYLEEDAEGDLVVHDANDMFKELFNIRGELPDPDSQDPLTVQDCMHRIENYVVDKEKNLPKIYCDQTKLKQEIIFNCGSSKALAPLTFSHRHPSKNFRGQCILPSLMSSETRGDKRKRHSTYYLICYLNDFWPIDHENNPYHENNPRYADFQMECKEIGVPIDD